MGSRTLPEGSCWSKGGWERQPYRSYPIPEHGASEWARSRLQKSDQRNPWTEKPVLSHINEIKHAGTNTNTISASGTQGKSDFNSTAERRKKSDQVSGIGGPAAALVSSQEVNQLSLDRAEQNWNRRGPSPIQRNILARKLKEAQSNSAAKGRKRSSSFTASSSDQRKGRCHSLPVTEEYTSSDGSPYKLSEAEQKMLDLDLSSSYVWEEE